MSLIHQTIFRNYRKSNWETYLEYADDSVVEETGLSKEKLHEILTILQEHQIVN